MRDTSPQLDNRLDRPVIDEHYECVARVSALFTDAKVRSFVPLLVRRYVNDELQERVERV